MVLASLHPGGVLLSKNTTRIDPTRLPLPKRREAFFWRSRRWRTLRVARTSRFFDLRQRETRRRAHPSTLASRRLRLCRVCHSPVSVSVSVFLDSAVSARRGSEPLVSFSLHPNRCRRLKRLRRRRRPKTRSRPPRAVRCRFAPLSSARRRRHTTASVLRHCPSLKPPPRPAGAGWGLAAHRPGCDNRRGVAVVAPYFVHLPANRSTPRRRHQGGPARDILLLRHGGFVKIKPQIRRVVVFPVPNQHGFVTEGP